MILILYVNSGWLYYHIHTICRDDSDHSFECGDLQYICYCYLATDTIAISHIYSSEKIRNPDFK